MKLICLGTLGYYPRDGQNTSCYMIPDLGIIFDAGSGLYKAVDHIKTPTLHIFLSHSHLDHIQGIFHLPQLFKNSILKKIIIYGSPNTILGVRTLTSSPLCDHPIDYVLQELNTPAVVINPDVCVKSFPLSHTCEVLGYRLTTREGAVGFITDTYTDANSEYFSQLVGITLLLHECYLEEGRIQEARTLGHTCVENLTEFCKMLGITNPIVIHHSPSNNKDLIIEQMKKTVPWAEAATDNAVYTF